MRTPPHEQEFKFEVLGNIQVKFAIIQPPDLVIAKVGALCELLGISIGPPVVKRIRDEYYDDDRHTLDAMGCTFRRRTVDGSRRVTIKVPAPEHLGQVLHRHEDEFDCGEKEFTALLQAPARLYSLLDLHRMAIRPTGLKKDLTVENTRTSVTLSTTAGRYELSYDKFFYYSAEGKYSEYFAEIEIEVIGDTLPDDDQLHRLLRVVPTILESQPVADSKHARGLRWAERPESAVTMYAVAFDLVGYSRRTSDVQKQMILLFNAQAKQALRDVRGMGAEKDVLYLPTGDGMIMLFETRPETLVPLVCRLQDLVKRANKDLPDQEKLSFRTGLHAGPVFRYSDVNGNVNVAGDGINVAVRAMTPAEPWCVLATREAFEAMGHIDKQLADKFVPLGKYATKHEVELELYNVNDRTRNCGCPEPLLDTGQ